MATTRDAREIVEKLRGRVPDYHVDARRSGDGSEGLRTVREVTYLRTKPVAWGIPLDELMFSRFFTNYLGLRVMPWDDMLTSTGTYISIARNTLHRWFLEESQCEHLVMLDSDVLPPPDFLQRLLERDLPMVGGWYRKKGAPYPPCVYDYAETDAGGVHYWRTRTKPEQGLERVDGAGAGCWLMHRSVAEKLGPAPYDMSAGGEDLTLCKRLRDLGVDVYIDWTIACAHAGVAYT